MSSETVTFTEWVAVQIRRCGDIETFAGLAGVCDTSVIAWRDGRALPMPDKIEELATATGTAESWLAALVHEARKIQAVRRRAAWARKPLARVTPSPSDTVAAPPDQHVA
ncbi:MAG TPA: hypothetical protein VFE48_25495 [Methylomirabilota bacterium]|nr:hypothetical protein [Methylomirabilota bacterium]